MVAFELMTESERESATLAARVAHILDQQLHCGHFLGPIADPAGKSVLVVGAGAGTEILWALGKGAADVIGIDLWPQPTQALELAARQLGVTGRFEILQMSVDDAESLGRQFDLVLSNNVFEHVQDLRRAFQVCARLVKPNTGRVAIFTDPLFNASCGSHLEHAPWEHLWADPEALDRRLHEDGALARTGSGAATSADFFERISLNRMRLADFLAALRDAGLVILHLRLLRDRHLDELPLYLERLAPYCARHKVAPMDLGVEGIAVELALFEPGATVKLRPPTEEKNLASTQSLEQQLLDARRRNAQLERTVGDLQGALGQALSSRSFRLGRALSWPWRYLAGLLRGRDS